MVDAQPYLVPRMRGFGTTIFAEMSALALRTGSVNLGQGFPDTDGPPEVLAAAIEAIRAGHNQYPPGPGIPALRQAIAEHQQQYYGLSYDPDREVLVTAGATEAIAAAILAMCDTGDEVVALEPTYDSYAASIAMAGGVLRPVTLRHPAYRLDLDELRAAVGPRTRLLLINSPHNPTGRVLDQDELAAIAELAVERDLIVVTDEVYEHLTFDRAHVPLATYPGMRDRTVTISSAGKTFSCTGWKIGWVCAAPALVDAVKTTKQFLTFVNGAPFQHAIVTGLSLPPGADRRDPGRSARSARPASRGPGRRRARGAPLRGDLLPHRGRPVHRRGPTDSRSAARCLSGAAWSPSRARCSMSTRDQPGPWSASRSASVPR